MKRGMETDLGVSCERGVTSAQEVCVRRCRGRTKGTEQRFYPGVMNMGGPNTATSAGHGGLPMFRGAAAAAARCLKVSGLVCWQYIPPAEGLPSLPLLFPNPSATWISRQFWCWCDSGPRLRESFWCSLSPLLQPRPHGVWEA